MLNNVPKIIAGGGGAGGGAGLYRFGIDPNGSITRNATGKPPTDYRGANGDRKISDGGSGGGGGGGYPGGGGGPATVGTVSQQGTWPPVFRIGGWEYNGRPGETGGNFPTVAASTGAGTLYYSTAFASGGATGGGNGQNGRIVLELQPQGLNSVKVGGEWKQVTESFVKVSGSWKSVNEIQVKVDGEWRAAEGSGISGFEFPRVDGDYGIVVRNYGS